jgi:hypothetical protein
MVFVPTHHGPVEPHEAAAAPRRPDHAGPLPPSATEGGKRFAWRAVAHMNKEKSVTTSWHASSCSAPLDPTAHCPEGQRLIESQQDPDGHCLIEGHCARCSS